MAKYVCTVCGYIYDGSDGPWEDLPESWECPLCGAAKSEFELLEEAPSDVKPVSESKDPVEFKEDQGNLTSLEMSALCSNLAQGLEKQYMAMEAEGFRELASYFKKVTAPAEDPAYSKMLDLLETDLNEDFPRANAVAGEAEDRGALRALVWTEKVSRIVKSLLNRYEKEGESLVEDKDVYVCTICGFIYIGDQLPEVCPVCKVPNWKFEMVEAR
ncbi:MAG: rubredoxin [Eubacteriales bacterium]|nr:rubredoxin [Eubacteriales bacterium]MDD4323891.1 rubredoxin [Eubacteriales bacterium]MDD4540544.1 rubredoxin [Eubacteriales bacterium]